VSSISEEGSGSLNGIVEGDRLVEVDGKPVVDSRTAINALANLYDRFGDTINIKIRRKNREITMECHMYYPELETTKRMVREARRNIAAGNLPDLSKDTEAPRILVLKPETRRGLAFVALGSIDIVMIASDNVGVKSLHVDGKPCEPVEGTFLLQGNTKKYKATVRAVEGRIRSRSPHKMPTRMLQQRIFCLRRPLNWRRISMNTASLWSSVSTNTRFGLRSSSVSAMLRR
jgi:hypothetical protein